MRLIVSSSQTVDGVTEHFSTKATANMRQFGSELCLSYEESLEGFEKPVKTLIRWNIEEHLVTMTRRGSVSTMMRFMEGEITPCEYQSTFGTLQFDIDTKRMRAYWNGTEGEILLSYHLLNGGMLTSKNELSLKFSENA